MSGNRWGTPRTTGAAWKRLRVAVLARDGERCTAILRDGSRCPRTERLYADHIVPDSLGGPTTMGNLQTLCKTHHDAKTGREGAAAARRRRDRRLRPPERHPGLIYRGEYT